MEAVRYPLEFVMGGAGYVAIELLYRRRSHISMFVAGGLCCWLLLALAAWPLPFVAKCLLAGLGITAVEFVVGCVVNLWLKLNVWSYADQPLNLLGQVCLPYTLAWCGLSAAVFWLVRVATAIGSMS